MVAVFLSPLYLLLNAYLFFRLVRWLAALNHFLETPWIVIPLLLCHLLLCLTPLAAVLLRGTPRYTARRISGYWMGVLLYLLLFLLTTDLIWLLYLTVSGQTLFQIPGRTFTGISGTATAAGVFLISAYGIRHASRLKRVSYEITLEKPSALKQLRIVLAADLHLGSAADDRLTQDFVQTVNAMHPDLILLAGDMFDNDFDAIQHPDEILRTLRRLRSTCGVWACWGNHDVDELILAGFTFSSKTRHAGCDPRMAQFLADAGIRILEDETIQFGQAFTLTGRLDRSCLEKSGFPRKTPAELAEQIDLSLPAIVLDHQPAELDELADAGFDLDLSGHTHDGQLFPSLIFTRLGWKNSYGIKKIRSMVSIVTSGAGVWGPAMRVGTHSEVAEITVRFQERQD